MDKNINLALKIATSCHRNQLRKGTTIPYISHPVAVAMIISKHTTDSDIITAGILHDILEDVDLAVYSEADMRRDFGDRITNMVKDVSEDKIPGNPDKTWRSRKQGRLSHFKSITNNGSLIVATADKIHNLTDILDDYCNIGQELWHRFNASKEDKLWYYQGFLAIVRQKDIPKGMLLNLESLVAELANVIKNK